MSGLTERLSVQSLVRISAGVAVLTCGSALALGLATGVPPWPRLVAAAALFGASPVFPVVLRLGRSGFQFAWGDTALVIGLALVPLPWLIPTAVASQLVVRLFRQAAYKAVYNSASRSLSLLSGGLAAALVQPGLLDVGSVRATAALVVGGMVFAVVSHLLTALAVAVAERVSWWDAFADGTLLLTVNTVGNVWAGLAILAVAQGRPLALILLLPALPALRFLYAGALRSARRWHLAEGLAAAQSLAQLAPAAVADALADAAGTLMRASAVRVLDRDGRVLATRGEAGDRWPGANHVEPLYAEGRSFGELQLLLSTSTKLAADERAALASLAAAASAAFGNALQHERTRHEAAHDQLTGLVNRRQLLAAAATALTARAGEPMAILLVDLERFKAVNDMLGHAAGDEVLRLVADRLRTHTRAHDTVARLGGDEFAVLLVGLPAAGGAAEAAALDVAHRIVGALGVPLSIDGTTVRVTGSVGVALAPDDAATVDGLLRCADRAMYAGKSRGGCRVTRYHDNLGANLRVM
jgi:diguanylate cyclase (GGDEF)-like protein